MSYEYRYRYVYIHEYFFDFASLEHVSSHLLMLKRNDNIKCRPVQIKKKGGGCYSQDSSQTVYVPDNMGIWYGLRGVLSGSKSGGASCLRGSEMGGAGFGSISMEGGQTLEVD